MTMIFQRKVHVLGLQLYVLLLLQYQVMFTSSAGLRGGNLSEWRKGLIEKDAALLTDTTAAFEENPAPLLCPFDSSSASNSDCLSTGSNRTTPVCQYNANTQEYTTLCLKTSHLNSMSALPNPHPKSYCGMCRKCFDDKDELQAAVDKYKSYHDVDVELASLYGWPIGRWCTDKVTSFSNLFFRKSKFNEDISMWNTERVTDMTSTFQNAYSFNQPLNSWDTSRVTSMTRMFAMAIHFDQNISSWDVSQVNDMGYMFLHALEFNQDISNWQVHNAFSLNSMFFGANKFQQDLLSKWQISEHADTENMCEWTQQPQDDGEEDRGEKRA